MESPVHILRARRAHLGFRLQAAARRSELEAIDRLARKRDPALTALAGRLAGG